MTNEQYLAGAILIDQQVISEISGKVAADDFQDSYCRAIFTAATAIAAEHGVVDPVSIKSKASRSGVDLSNEFLVQLMEIVPTAANCVEYAFRVAEDARTRKIKELAAQIQEDNTSTATELVARLQKETSRLSNVGFQKNALLDMFKPLSKFSEDEAAWLIPGWVPEGQITIIAADGGVGKTTLWVNIIAALSAGRRCILDPIDHIRQPMKIAFCTSEDSVKKKLRKKLREADANMDNIITMDISADKDGILRNFKFGSPEMELFVKQIKPAACVFDPIQGFVPSTINMGSRNEMRDCLAPLIGLGEDVGTTFLIICHTNKRKGASARERISDSSDIWDIARSVIMAGFTETQGIRYISNEKNNYAQLQETILFSIDDSGRLRREGTSWKRDKEYMLDATVAKSAPKREDCKDFILSVLKNTPGQYMKSDDLVKKAQEYGYSFATVKRSRKELKDEHKVENYSTGSNRKGDLVWYIRLKQMEEMEQAEFDLLPDELPVPFEPLPSA